MCMIPFKKEEREETLEDNGEFTTRESWRKVSVTALGKLKEEQVQGSLELSSSNVEKLNIID